VTDATDVALVGAGLAGLSAARALRERGADVALVDKGGRPGGRCATRTLAGAVIDTGAQFFTVRDPRFAAVVEAWRAEGVPIREWASGWAQAASAADGPAGATDGGDGHPRYSVEGGMNRLAAHLARDLDVRCDVCVPAVRAGGSGWQLVAGGPTVMTAAAAVVTPPVPQTLALLHAGGVRLDLGLVDRLARQTYERCITLLVALDRAPGLPVPGGVQFRGGDVAWLADGVAKGASRAPCVTVHAAAEYSEDHAGDTDLTVTRHLLGLVRPWLAPADAIATQVFRWRFSKPHRPTDDGAVVAASAPGPLVLAGDAFAGAKVEGAVTSGLRAADLVIG